MKYSNILNFIYENLSLLPLGEPDGSQPHQIVGLEVVERVASIGLHRVVVVQVE